VAQVGVLKVEVLPKNVNVLLVMFLILLNHLLLAVLQLLIKVVALQVFKEQYLLVKFVNVEVVEQLLLVVLHTIILGLLEQLVNNAQLVVKKML